MIQNKNAFRIIVAALVAIAGFVIFSCTNNKKKDEAVSTTIASTKPAKDTFRVRTLTNIQYERTAERLKRGEYLSKVYWNVLCVILNVTGNDRVHHPLAGTAWKW